MRPDKNLIERLAPARFEIFTYGAVLIAARSLPVVALYFASFKANAEDFGAAAILITAYTTAGLISDSGLETSATYLVSRVNPISRQAHISALQMIRVVMAVSLALVLVAIQAPVVASTSEQTVLICALAAVAAGLGAMNSVRRVELRIIGNGERSNILTEKFVCAALFMFFVVVAPADPLTLVCGFFGSAIAGSVIVWRPTPLGGINKAASVAIVRNSLPFVVSAIATATIWRTPVFVLGQVSVKDAGYFALAVYPVQLLGSVAVFAAPLLLIKSRWSTEQLRDSVPVSLFLGVASLAVAAFATLIGRTVVPQHLVDSNVWNALLVLALCLPFVFVNPIRSAQLRVGGTVWAPTVAHWFGALTSVMVGICLIPRTFAPGAAVAVLAGEVGVAAGLFTFPRLQPRVARYIQRFDSTRVATAGIGGILFALAALAIVENRAGAQLLICILAIMVAATRDFEFSHLPILLRPTTVICGAACITSLFALGLSDQGYWAYMSLWTVQILGLIAGALVPIARTHRLGPPRTITKIDAVRLSRFAIALFVISFVLFLMFVALKGLPILGSDVEQGRVDAASSGTGYLRLGAYMCIPATLALFGTRSPLRYLAIIMSALIVLGLGNRSPLVYLLGPVLVIYILRNRPRYANIRLLLSIVGLLLAIVSIGTYRIVSQVQFRNYAEYRAAISNSDYVDIAWTSLSLYADVVARNAILVKRLVDQQIIDYQYGQTYFTLFVTAFPGEQLSLDRLIKKASGAEFIGGGTPPTLMGEGYVNYGYLGTFLICGFVVFIGRYFAARLYEPSTGSVNLGSMIMFSYCIVWFAAAQVAGLAGASTFPVAGICVLALMMFLSRESTGQSSFFIQPSLSLQSTERSNVDA